MTMTEIYVIIETGYEGIEALLYATTDKNQITEKVKQLRKKAIQEKIRLRKEMSKHWREEGHPELCEPESLTDEEKQNIEDFICVQKWNGKKFDCVCQEFDVSPSKLMLR